ncbi:MAG: hypothetical protein ACXWQO_06080 [Bdellovibrionota bacterium]
MSLRKKIFTSQKISLFFGGKEYRMQALVSVYGVKYAFDEVELPEEARNYLGYEVQMTYKGVPARCRIIGETNSVGKIYNLRFVNPSQLLVRQIERDIRDSGLPSPWLRFLPRLTTELKDLPSPALAVLYHGGETHYLNVKNFTLGGLLLEQVGIGIHGVGTGTRFDFDLVTNQGDKFEEISGVVTRVSVEVNENDGSASRNLFGLKFLPMGVINETKYRQLIRDHCTLLRTSDQRMSAEEA